MTDPFYGPSRTRDDEWVFDAILVALDHKPGQTPTKVDRRASTPSALTQYQTSLLASHCTQVHGLAHRELVKLLSLLKQRTEGSTLHPEAFALRLIEDQRRGLLAGSLRIRTEAFLEAMSARDRVKGMARLLYGNQIASIRETLENSQPP